MSQNPGQKNVLIIDDDPVVHILATSIIESMNFKVTGFYNISDAENFLSSSNRIHLTCCDMNLPDGDGLDFLIKFKKIHPDIPFILMSAEKIPEDKSKQMAISPELFLAKPFTANQLIDAIRNTV